MSVQDSNLFFNGGSISFLRLNPDEFNPEDATVQGSENNNYILTEEGEETYFTGLGNDFVKDFTDSDNIYYFNLGDGQDRIQDTGGNDTIVLGEDYSPDSISFSRDGENLIINSTITDDSIKVLDWYKGDSNRIENIGFLDSAVITSDATNTLFDYDSYVTGSEYRDYILTEEGVNAYFTGLGNDFVKDFTDSDNLYLYTEGAGEDRIQDTGGLDTIGIISDTGLEDISFSREENDLVINYGENGDNVSVLNWFSDQANRIEEITLTTVQDGISNTFDLLDDIVSQIDTIGDELGV